jgi:hypothetical protein
VLDPRARQINDTSARLASHANRQLGFLAAKRNFADPPDPVCEPVDAVEGLAAKRHVCAERVADLARLLRQTDVAAADHPVELGRKPARRLRLPARDDLTACADHLSPSIRPQQPKKPVRLRSRVVVEEDNDIARSMVDSGVASP